MKYENLGAAIELKQKIDRLQERIDNFESGNALELRIELQFTGGRIGVDTIKKGTSTYEKMVKIITEPIIAELRKLKSEYYKLDNQQ